VSVSSPAGRPRSPAGSVGVVQAYDSYCKRAVLARCAKVGTSLLTGPASGAVPDIAGRCQTATGTDQGDQKCYQRDQHVYWLFQLDSPAKARYPWFVELAAVFSKITKAWWLSGTSRYAHQVDHWACRPHDERRGRLAGIAGMPQDGQQTATSSVSVRPARCIDSGNIQQASHPLILRIRLTSRRQHAGS
jgi:hypothetical protein